MATMPDNILQQVATYQKESLAFLLNSMVFVSTANTKFKDFPTKVAQLGQTVNIQLQNRYTTTVGLVASIQATVERLQSLTCDQAANSSYGFTAQDFMFNADQYMDSFGKSAMVELASYIEENVGKNATSSVPVMTVNSNGQSVPTGALYTNSGPYRFYGDGTTPINSFGQLAQMLANFRNYGNAGDIKVYLPDVYVPSIVNSGLNQFALNRNNDLAMSWELGRFNNATFYSSNLLPIHYAGNVGDNGQTLTVVSTNDPTGANITQITFSGASNNDVNAIKANDLLQFNDDVGSFPNLRYLTFTGHAPSASPVQFRATADAESNGSGQVTVNIFPALQSTPGANQNLTNAIQAGMQVSVLPSHQSGLVVSGNAFYIAMPALPNTDPYKSSNQYDMDSGVSIRNYYGYVLGQNQNLYVNDCIWGSTLVPEYSMRLAFPLSPS
jgi:hypothetical protein